jgi:hypothetical protein
LERIGTYANARDILKKGREELQHLKGLGLGMIYLGLESGNPEVLQRIKKNATVDQMIRAAAKVREAGILLSVTVLLGIGGVEGSQRHAEDTGTVSRRWTRFCGALPHGGSRDTRGARDRPAGAATPFGLIEELQTMILLRIQPLFLYLNHASNYLPLKIQMPEQKESLLRIRQVLEKKDPRLRGQSF